MDKKLKDTIEKILVNDESSTDQELFEHLTETLKISKEIAKKCISQRGKALGDLDFKLKLN